ncbi:protein phosphatase 2C domain-containing protein [Oscillatoriales cyanobacterium LEGE 11467]|uniref:Protein phosphatase 2C domain-containing protein n=1 Tax=Zarconia navalis LEGE 11467 TaxID=1828826 RepID=A0A928ZAD7_9CYAN|nr:protein phosphatase 2C domain-containing protein [Zarconia navalis]MBE9042744.1 protein phosphatase 2C domain-containing protein [Zarconia navalis LEGE 11467]
MQSPTATLHCPNPSCHAPNPEGNQFCQKCGTWVPKYYLWPVGSELSAQPGQLLADRYLHKGNGILLDTHPGLLPEMTDEIPEFIESYLKLFVHQLHVPQVYGRISPKAGGQSRDIWLLEKCPVEPLPEAIQLRPSIDRQWSHAEPSIQLGWLWQIARLWQPCAEVGVAASLLRPELLRVEGSLVRLLELVPDRTGCNLEHLGQVWGEWVDRTATPLKAFLDRLCTQLRSGEVQSSEQLIALLDRGLRVLDAARSRQIQVATASDRGPSRSRNEDACYPDSGTERTVTTDSLAIVCDGVGGHEGGDVASRMAISTIQGQLQSLLDATEELTPESIGRELEHLAYEANTAIGAQNNSEHRQGRQRMGTTLVMGLTHGREMYLTHVGDSRGYLITRTGCYQLTLDDDVASREVRLGYALYRDALQQVASGSLVQALGMGPSTTLHPTIERFVLGEDCAFLLCSDGLSDYDRVEQHWEEEILPLLHGKTTPSEVVRRLVEIANTENGHDNVTVALLSVRVAPKPKTEISIESLCDCLESVPPPPSLISQTQTVSGDDTATLEETADLGRTENLTENREGASTVLAPPPKSSQRSKVLLVLLSFLATLAIAAALAYQFAIPFRKQVNGLLNRETAPSEPISENTARPAPVVEEVTPIAETLGTNALIRTKNAVVLQPHTEKLDDTATDSDRSDRLEVPPQSLLQVANRQEIEGEIWLQLERCKVAQPTEQLPVSSTTSPDVESAIENETDRTVTPTQTKEPEWILQKDLEAAEFELIETPLPPEELGSCQSRTPSSEDGGDGETE